MANPKVAIVVSHPIQHFCPMYAQLATSTDWEIYVFFASSFGAKTYYDANFKKNIAWLHLRLDEFPHEFLNDDIPDNAVSLNMDAPNLNERLNYYQPDIVIIYGYFEKLSRRAITWASKHSKTVLVISDAELRSSHSLIRNFAKRILLPLVFRQVSGYLSVGDANEAYYQLHGASPQTLFRSPFPIDLELYESAWVQRTQMHQSLRAELGVPNDRIICSVIGKLEPRKRQKDIVLALQQSSLPDNTYVLLLIGSGEMETELKEVAGHIHNQEVRFIGFVEPELLPRFYAATDIYVHPSSFDPHPLAISEAIFMGCPVIVSQQVGSVGPSDDAQVGRNALVYPSGDITRLTQLLDRLGRDSRLRAYFGENSHAIAINNQQLAHGQGLKNALIALGYL